MHSDGNRSPEESEIYSNLEYQHAAKRNGQ